MIGTIASGIWTVITAVPAALSLFNQVQDLYYTNLFNGISDDVNQYKEKRRAISNSIENASNDDDRRALSIVLAELQERGHRESAGSSSDPK